MALARWVKSHGKRLAGAAARDMRLRHVSTKQGRIALERRLVKQLGDKFSVRGLLTLSRVGRKTSGVEPSGIRGPTLPKQLPAVCLATELWLSEGSPTHHILHMLRQLRAARSVPRALLVHQLRNFDDSCMDALIAVLKRHPRIFALNIGEAAKNLSRAALHRFVGHLQSPLGARIACLYLCDTHTPKDIRESARAAIGKARREATEAKARAILAEGAPKAVVCARRLVPWRCPHVWAELERCNHGHNNVRWAMSTWKPKTSWKVLA